MKIFPLLREGLLWMLLALATPVASAQVITNAGIDATVADYDDDGSVTLKLDGSGSHASLGDPAAVTYDWTWTGGNASAGGNASGRITEGVFPVTNSPVTVTLVVTDQFGNNASDTLQVTAYSKQAGLFTEFVKPSYSGVDPSTIGSRVVGTLKGNTFVIDPIGEGVPEIYRLQAGVWTPSPFIANVHDIRAVEENTLVSGRFYNGTNFTVHRFVSGSWVATPLGLSATPPIVSRFDYAFDPETVVFADLFNTFHASGGGRVFAYDWTGNTWTHSELLPPSPGPNPITPGTAWGAAIDIDDDLMVVVHRGPPAPSANLHLFKKIAGNWVHQIALAPPIEPGGYGQSYFGEVVSVGNGVVVAQRNFPHTLFVIEFNGTSWTQTQLPANGMPSNGYTGLDMDDDGKAFVAHDQSGNFVLFEDDPLTPLWTQRVLPVADLTPSDKLLATEFSGGKIVISDPLGGVVRIIDKSTPFDTANAEPVANAGPDITTTSFDGQPVRVFLNGGASIDIDAHAQPQAIWSWNGGSVPGLQAFASIPPEVTSIELTVIDEKGAISRDTLSVDVSRPPVVNPGANAVVADSDGDGLIHLHLDPAVVSQDNPIVSWNWHWPGGSFSGQSGTITLGPDADGKPVTLEVIDSNGLSSSSQFSFDLLKPNPVPDILEPADGKALDNYGWSVAINDDTAFIGAPDKLLGSLRLGATYVAGNINSVWQQLSLSPYSIQGDAVLLDDDFAFVGARARTDGSQGTGRVVVYQKSFGQWVAAQTLDPPDADGLSFGASIARSGNFLVIGAPESTTSGVSGAGAAYIFELLGGVWIQRMRLPVPTGHTPSSYENFGATVAIDATSIAVSCPGFASPSKVFFYERTGSVIWLSSGTVQSEVPRAPQGRSAISEGDYFGGALAIAGNELLIGSPQDDKVFRYARNAGTWTANGSIYPGYYRFGKSIALHDGVLVVGSVLDNVGAPGIIPGSVSTFLLNGGSWQEIGYLTTNATLDPTAGSSPDYGYSVAHDGKDLIVGLPKARKTGNIQSGKAYIYRNYAALNPNANYEPLADAGPDLFITDTIVRGPAPGYAIVEPPGSEEVVLDASASTDRENAIVSYEWTWPGGSATGESAIARFPVGSTPVTLTVKDGANLLHSDTVVVYIGLPQTPPDSVPVTTGNTLTVNLPVPGAKWRLSSEFLWHGDGESVNDVVLDEDYQVEIIPWPGAADAVTTIVTVDTTNAVADLSLVLPVRPLTTGVVRFPETAQGFTWRLTGESAWRNVTDDNDGTDELIDFVLPVGDYRIEFKPVSGYATPQSRLIGIRENLGLGLNWSDYLRINNFDASKTFSVATPDLSANPWQYVGMIRTPLGRGTGTVVAERVVLTAGHLFFDSTGLQWADTQWFSRQQQGTRQAPPVTPRGILYRTSYAKLVAPDSVEGTVANLPDDDQEVDFAVLYFGTESDWLQGSSNFLQSSSARNWLTGPESKRAVAYPQRSQAYEQRGMIFEKSFTTALSPLDSHALPKLYETGEVFGDGGASGSALFVQPQGAAAFYPAAILFAGQGRAVYHVIDDDVGRMIKDGQDAASGNDEVLDNNSSLVTYGGLGGFTTLAVNIGTPSVLSTARWSVTPNSGTGYSNLKPTQQVAFNANWASFTISFSAVSGFVTPPPRTFLKAEVAPGGTNTLPVIYDPVTGYDLWKQTQGIASDDDDRDHDGRGALIEYAINGNPNSGSDPTPIRIAANPSQNVNAEFEVFVSSTADAVRYTVKASNTLPPTNISTLATFTQADGSNGYKRVTDSQPRSSSNKRFAWVEITHDRSLSTGP
ncbi:hypothetical protein OKA05_18405 [Luteolibacter arcticus]|uniref:PKD/Chitinase domain-containing protein n=1 Tax=Luteolibacter arcticus TaxID=1581411 RepID=A0ABT3GLZ2_9BACT|nr:hypothetical protein [Luteolibacter arcticus]MCW1924544.1 hypothetical protein [Luteolibacter arcticus]